MNLEAIILSEVSQRQIYDIASMWNLKKNDTNELIYRNRPTDIKDKFMATRGKIFLPPLQGRKKLGVWD